MPRGKISLILGSMYSGKTTEMLTSLRRYQLAKKRCLLIRYSHDMRYDEQARNGGIVTHDGHEFVFDTFRCDRLSKADGVIRDYDVIGIDEGQFFTDIADADTYADIGKIVVVSALDGDYLRRPFGNIHLLIPHCEKVVKKNAVCSECGEDAAFTKRIVAGDALIDIGADDKYRAACRQCYAK